jgi:uncharacterized phage-associated protein
VFNERKTAQAAAYLIGKSGGTTPLLKLIKLLYLVDREALRRYHAPISGDNYVSMDHGPVLSQTYDLTSGGRQPVADGWESWISDRQGHNLSVRREGAGRDDFDELSDSDIGVMDDVYQQYGRLNKWELVELTHDEQVIPEWEDPQGSSLPIPLRRIFQALGHSREQSVALTDSLKDADSIAKLLASL